MASSCNDAMSLRESINNPLGVVIPALLMDCASDEVRQSASGSVMPIREKIMCLRRASVAAVVGAAGAGAGAAPAGGADMVVGSVRNEIDAINDAAITMRA